MEELCLPLVLLHIQHCDCLSSFAIFTEYFLENYCIYLISRFKYLNILLFFILLHIVWVCERVLICYVQIWIHTITIDDTA